MLLQQDTLFDNRYLLVRLLGCGGFSEVWLVEDTKVSHKKMALKVFAPDKGLDEDGVRLFSSEFELVFDLNHSHLLRPSYFSVYERSPFLLMPFCEQGSVTKLAGHLAEEDAWHVLHDVAAGLAYLHLQNPPIIHQDIKPDNILKDGSGNYQISDFGISTKVRSTLRKSMSNVNSVGTIAYMPPERFSKENIPIMASDVWATGATLYEMLSGELPFGEHGGLMQKSGAEIPNIPGKWSKDLIEIIERCLRKYPWDRPVAQQIVDWTDSHFRGEAIVFYAQDPVVPEAPAAPDIPEKKNPNEIFKNKKLLITGGGVIACLILVFMLVKYLMLPATDAVPEKIAQESEYVTNVNMDKPDEPEPVVPEEAISTMPVETVKPADNDNKPAAWLTEYNRTLVLAQSAYQGKDFQKAKTEFNKALTLAIRNSDSQKVTFVNGMIAECDKALDEAAKAVEATRKLEEENLQKAIKERLAAYNFVGNNLLGPDFMIVQNKSNNRWGIINKDGTVKESFDYNQVSTRLKDGCYALKNDKGWVVFDTSSNKIADGLEKLDDYR
jgi:serine/threonine protein kinase